MGCTSDNLAAVVAHPDDFAHGMGGTSVLLSEKYRFHVFCFTSGQKGIPGKGPGEAGAIREAEEQKAAAEISGSVTFYRQMDGELYAGRELCEDLAVKLKEVDPAAVFTLWPINVPDHSAVSNICTSAMHLAEIYFTSELYFLENGIGGQTNQFDPDMYVDISGVIEQKREMVTCHASQNPDKTAVDNVIFRNVYRGKAARVEYAEVFKTVHAIGNRRWDRKAGSILLDIV